MPEEDFDPLKLFKHLFQKEKNEPADSPQKHTPAIVKFLDWMEGLDYDKRIKRVIDLGKECLSDDSAVAEYAKSLLQELEKGSFYERQLALMSCPASKDCERIMRFSRDASARLRQLAADLAVVHCNDSDLHDMLLGLKLKQRRRVLKKLRRARRQSVVDSFLKILAEQESDDFRDLVYFGSTELLKASLEKIGDRMSPQDASRFAYLHADLCIDFLSDYAKTCSREDPRLLSLLWGSTKWISEFRPERTLTLFESLLSLYPASRLVYRHILQLRPAQAVPIFARQADYGGVDLSPVLHKLPDEMVLQAVAHRQFASSISAQLKRFSAKMRQEVFDSCLDGWRNADGAISPYILEQLNSEQRVIAARKHMGLPNLSVKLAERLNYARLLDWEELQQAVADSLNNPDPENRGQAFFCLVYAVKFNRTRLNEILELLHKRKNEPDPVRDKFLSALSFLPPSIFAADSLELFATVIDDALKAQDLSFGCLSSIGRLLLRLFPFQRDWVVAQLCRLLKDRGPYMLTSHPCRLLAADVEFLSKQLKPIVEFWEKKERESEIIQFARWLGLRLPSSEPLNEALCSLSRVSETEYNSESAAHVLHDWNRSRFEALVPELLKLDKSWSLKPLIYEYLSRKRQSLLTAYLGQNTFKGRFATGKTRVVPNYTRDFQKWTRKQLDIYSHELSLLIEQESSTFADRFYGVYRLCRLPEPDLKVLARVASLSNKDEALRDMSIRQMANTDNGSALPILLDCLNDERARQAIYALRTAVLGMEPEMALGLLKTVPREKITIFKEVVRLAGDTACAEAFAWLTELEATDLHRDVRVALLRAFWNFPEKNETWAILRNTVAKGDPVFAETAIRIPVASLSSQARTHLLQLYNDALQSKEAGTRLKTLSQIAASPLLDERHLLVESLASCLASAADDECRSASWTIGNLYAGRDPDILSKYLEGIVQAPRNLRTFTQQLQVRFSRQAEIFAGDARNLCLVMNKYPRTGELSITMAGAMLPWLEFYEMLKTFDESARLHFGVMQAACQSLSQPARGSALAGLSAMEEKLKSEKSDNLRRLGLAALCGLSNSASGWTAERLQKLRNYREDPSLMVASCAEFILPSAELVPTAEKTIN